jgi:hypothetical protein
MPLGVVARIEYLRLSRTAIETPIRSRPAPDALQIQITAVLDLEIVRKAEAGADSTDGNLWMVHACLRQPSIRLA